MKEKHWSKVEYLYETVKNPNIVIKGTKSYYSNAYTPDFEDYVVRYLYGDEYSRTHFEPLWEYDKLYIGNYVCMPMRELPRGVVSTIPSSVLQRERAT